MADSATSPGRPRWQKVLYTVGAVLALAAIAYGVAWFQGRAKAKVLETELEAARSQCAAELSQRQQVVDQKSQQVRWLEARRHLGLAREALARKNFGTAHEHVGKAAVLLKTAGNDAVSALGAEVGQFRLKVAADVEPQSEQLASFIQRFDQVVPPEG